MSDCYKHVPSSCALFNEMTVQDDKSSASDSSASTPEMQNTPTHGIKNDSIFKATAVKVGLIKKRTPSNPSSTCSNESIKLNAMSSASSINNSDELDYVSNGRLTSKANFQYEFLLNGKKDLKSEKIYYDDLKTISHKHQTTIDVYQTTSDKEKNTDLDDLKFNQKRTKNDKKQYTIVFILFVVNLLNFADRYSIAGEYFMIG
jgi:hypothetical protein